MKVCGDCARFKVPDSGCTYLKDIREGLMDARSTACDDFYRSRFKKQKRKREPPHKACGVSEEGTFEAIYHKGEPCFLVKNEKGYNIMEKVSNRGKTFSAKEIGEFPYEPYGYFQGSVPNREDLFWKVRDEFELFVDVDSIYKDLLAASVLLSYQQEKVRTVPYLYLFGDNESGKTVVLGLLSLLCYRPLYGVTIPPADIYGYLDDSDSPGTILEDEIQGLYRDLDKSKIYKAGYKDGATVPRTFMLEHRRFIKYFRCFCFKAVAAEKLPRLKGVRERFVFIQMVEGFPKKDWADITREDMERIRQLRNMLLKWRLASWEWQLPEINLSCRGRLKEMWKPILQITHDLTIYDTLFKFVENQRKERLSSKQDTLEGHIVKVVSKLYNREPIPFPEVWDNLVVELDGKLDEKKPHQMDTSEFFTVTKSKVGYRLREVLGGRSKNTRYRGGVTKGYEFEEEKLVRVVKKYGYVLVAKLPSLPSSRRVTTPKTMEKGMEKTPSTMEKKVRTPSSNSATNVELGYSATNIDIKTILSVVALDPVTQGACPICKKRDVSLVWQVLMIDGSRYDAVCMDCGGYLQEELRKRD